MKTTKKLLWREAGRWTPPRPRPQRAEPAPGPSIVPLLASLFGKLLILAMLIAILFGWDIPL